MCGIAGIITKQDNAVPFLMNALTVLETRGYDGYGIAVLGADTLRVAQNKLAVLKDMVLENELVGVMGIAHNRWATHGPPSVLNSHPQKSGPIRVVHNGDIDNDGELRTELQDLGYHFTSGTDTEVFAVLVEHHRKTSDLFSAVKQALLRLDKTSTYAFLVMDDTTPGQLVAATMGSPLIWSVEGGITRLASQESAFAGFVQTYQELSDGDVALFEVGALVARDNITGELQEEFKTYAIDPEHYTQPEKVSDYWMYQEMMQAAETIKRAIGKRATIEDGIVLGGIEHADIQTRLAKIKKFYFAGCGTSYHAALIMARAMKEIAGIDAEAVIASEAIYDRWVFDPETTALVAVSQSGETADLVKLMKTWKPRGLLMLGIVNVPNTQIPKLTDAGIYCHVGKEVAVASTKAFLGQVVCGTLLALWMGQQRGMTIQLRNMYIEELKLLPLKAHEVLKQKDEIQQLAREYAAYSNFLFIGRGYNSVVAKEGALKLKEITFNERGEGMHALGIESGEMKHGTLAMISEQFPTFVIAPDDSVLGATTNNMSEIQARKGPVLLVTNQDTRTPHVPLELKILVPKTLECLSPVLTVIPTQIFAFYASLERGCNPDMPLNLAKAVTVE